jgi:hypothetical protein
MVLDKPLDVELTASITVSKFSHKKIEVLLDSDDPAFHSTSDTNLQNSFQIIHVKLIKTIY